MKKPELVVIDGCAILWVVNWPTNGLVSDTIANYCDFVFLKLQSHDIAVVFDRYHDFSIKSSTRVDRGKFYARTHFLTPSSPLPGKSVTLTSASCKNHWWSDTKSCLRLLFQHPTDYRAVSNSFWNNSWGCNRRTRPEDITWRSLHIHGTTSISESSWPSSWHCICNMRRYRCSSAYFCWKSHLSITVLSGTVRYQYWAEYFWRTRNRSK